MRLIWLSVLCARAGQAELLKALAQIVYKFRRNFSHAHGQFEEQNKALEPSKIMINYWIIIIKIIIT